MPLLQYRHPVVDAGGNTHYLARGRPITGVGTPPVTTSAILSGFEVFGNPPGLSSLVVTASISVDGALNAPPISSTGVSALVVNPTTTADGVLAAYRGATLTVTASRTATGTTDTYSDTYSNTY